MGAPDTILNGRYQLDQLIGRGGFANVFLATDLRLRRQVAVKVLDPGLVALPQHQDFLARFEREAQAVAALDHPNILGIYDSGETGSTVYLVMPYVAGGSLDERLRREGRLSLNLTGLYVGQAAAALDYAHRRGIVHRDVKPQNMLLRAEDDRLLLADFGIAKLLGESTAASSRSAAVGTLAYMAPEQFRGEVTPAVDIYALGCVLFQLLTGTPPFNGPTEQIVYGHLHGPVPSVVERSKGIVPEAAQGVIDRALAKHPGERFASAGELARAFVAVSGESRAAPTYALHPVPPLSPAHDQATQRGASPAVTLGRV